MSNEHDFKSYLWNEKGLSRGQPSGTYIAVSGNTAAGKSTLVRHLSAALGTKIERIVGVDESALEHPFLSSLFSDPNTYGLGVQLNFLVQRHLMLLRWLDAGFTVVIERSHLGDYLFIDHLLSVGYITQSEHAAYSAIANSLHERTPPPDVLICLDIDVETAMRRLTASEAVGERPKSFPNDDAKYAFVSSWDYRYREFHEVIASRFKNEERFRNSLVVKFSALEPTELVVQKVLDMLLTRGVLDASKNRKGDEV